MSATPDLTPMADPATAPPKRARGRPSATQGPAAPDDKLLALALRAFAENGYEAMSMRELGRHLGVSHNLIPARFGSKENLWRRAVDAALAPTLPMYDAIFADPALSDEERLQQVLESCVRWSKEHPDVLNLLNDEGRSESWRLDYLYQRYVQPAHQPLEALLHRIALLRGTSVISATSFTVLLLHGLGNYLSVGPLSRRLGVSEHTRDQDVAQIVGMMLRAVRGEFRP